MKTKARPIRFQVAIIGKALARYLTRGNTILKESRKGKRVLALLIMLRAKSGLLLSKYLGCSMEAYTERTMIWAQMAIL